MGIKKETGHEVQIQSRLSPEQMISDAVSRSCTDRPRRVLPLILDEEALPVLRIRRFEQEL